MISSKFQGSLNSLNLPSPLWMPMGLEPHFVGTEHFHWGLEHVCELL